MFKVPEVLEKFADDRHSGKLAQKAAETKLKRYNDPNYNNMDKNKQTKLERYGDDHYNNQQKREETCLERYGVSHQSLLPEVRQKISDTWKANDSYNSAIKKKLDKYNGDIEAFNQAMADKRVETMHKNNTIGSVESKSEKELFNLLVSLYGEEDVLRQYKDKERYPFFCDFYIKSKDMFIELNAHWTHGPHPYDPSNEEDNKLLENWQNKNSKFYKNAINVWTVADVKKQMIAKQNNLNYIAIYNKDDIKQLF